jgi:hypothetical protein
MAAGLVPGHLFWTSGGMVNQANLDGSNQQAIVSGQDGPAGVAVDASHLYWANDPTGAINRANEEGNGRARYWSPLLPTTAPPVGDRVGPDAGAAACRAGVGHRRLLPPCNTALCPSAPSSNAAQGAAVGGLQSRLARVESGRQERRARPGDARVLSRALPAGRSSRRDGRRVRRRRAPEIVEDKVGTGSTDFWGISFSPSATEQGRWARQNSNAGITLPRACWAFFDGVAARVSPEMGKGPRGGGRDRDQIIRHTIRTESEDFAKQVGVRIPEGAALTPDGLRQHREAYVAAMRAYNAGEATRRMRSWTPPFLIRHSAYHTLDHAWEMEDKDLSAQDGA